jgi:hypothetical protein
VDNLNAIGADRNTELRVARRAAIGAAEAFWLALIAALVAWAVSPSANPSRGSSGSSLGCLFVGKGAVICNRPMAAAQKIPTEDADRCLSFGKGGRHCAPAKWDVDPTRLSAAHRSLPPGSLDSVPNYLP